MKHEVSMQVYICNDSELILDFLMVTYDLHFCE